MEHVRFLSFDDENIYAFRINLVDEKQIQNLARKFPNETNDSFYSHTQRAFSQSNKDSKYIYTCKKIDKNRIEVYVRLTFDKQNFFSFCL